MNDNPYQQMPSKPVLNQQSKELALQRVKTPAILLIVSGVVGVMSGIFGGGSMAVMYLGLQEQILVELENEPPDPELTPEMMKVTMDVLGWGGVALAVLGLITGIIAIMAGISMMKLRGWGFAMIAAVLSLVPFLQGCCFFSVPVGIYAIVVLFDSQVRPAFE